LEAALEKEYARFMATIPAATALPPPAEKGQGDKEKGQKKRRPLNDNATRCLNEFNRRRDSGQTISMAQHCREFAAPTGDSANSLYRTLKDYRDLWHKPKKRDTNGTK
jgi:hypothetical protein